MGFKEQGEKLYENVYDVARRYSAQWRRIAEFKKKTSPYALTAEQVEEVKSFYRPYRIPNLVFHRFYTEKTGVFRADYLPQDIYVGYVDPYFNDIREARYLDNKCYYEELFNGFPQPATVLKRVNNIWLDGERRCVPRSQVREVIMQEKGDLFVKEAQGSAGGHGVIHIRGDEDGSKKLDAFASAVNTDFIIQRGVVQHEKLAKLNSDSVNSMRIYSILKADGTVKEYSSVLRMGIGGMKVDNYSAGGVVCGISEQGKLRKYGYVKSGDKQAEHPTSGLVFEGYEIPSYFKALEMVKRAHLMIPHFRSVSWDIAIDQDAEPVLIEANLCRGGIDLLQLCNGPLYGGDTAEILDEVFRKKQS